jgi:hypothetical protein
MYVITSIFRKLIVCIQASALLKAFYVVVMRYNICKIIQYKFNDKFAGPSSFVSSSLCNTNLVLQ